MPEDQPETLNLGGAGYSDELQSFTLRVAAKHGMATAGERADFMISADLVISDASGELARASGTSPVRKAGVPAAGSNLVPLEDARVAWGRLGGTFSGSVDLAVSARLTKNGSVVANSETSARFVGVAVGRGGTPS